MISQCEGGGVIWGGGRSLVNDTMMDVEGALSAVLQIVLQRNCHRRKSQLQAGS